MNVWATRTIPLHIVLALLTSGCSDTCSVDVLNESASPDGKYVATVFERNCGATTPYVRGVNLRDSDSEFESEASENWVFTIHGQSEIQLLWVDNTELNVSYIATGDSPTRRTKWEKITITY